MGLARQEHDSRIPLWERFATRLTRTGLSSSRQLHEVIVLMFLANTKYAQTPQYYWYRKYYSRYIL